MIISMIRATILVFTAVVMMRLMGKRQISQLQPYELVIAIMIAELAATPMGDSSLPLLYGIVPMLTLMMLHAFLSLATLKSQKLRAIICGLPSTLIKGGVIQEEELRRNCFDLNDLLEEVRACGVLNPAEVGTAILETSGKMSVFPHAKHRPLTPKDMEKAVDYEGIPLTLVMDGDVQYQNLALGGLNENWLNRTLQGFGFKSPKEVFLASLDTKGTLFAQGRGNKPRMKVAQVLDAQKVCW